ncbi:uncharacterized protein [Ptychodera flava]|uniref:uncharacterized protein isoform X1 n=1 Tax=Ptychodera flava TaxID=63121 RepID=UPI00396A9496
MQWCVTISVLLFSVSAKGSLFNKGGHHDDLFHFGIDSRPKYRDLRNDLKTFIGISPDSPPFLHAVMSGRVSVPVARVMLSRYQLDNGGYMIPVIRGLQSREDLLLTLIMFHQMRSAVDNTLLDGLTKEKDDRTYIFLVDAVCNCSLHYASGQEIKGFFPDLLDAVCKEAGKKYILQPGDYRWCHGTVPGTDFEVAGKGILSGQYDGCIVTKTSGIVQAMALSDSWMKYGGESRFFVPVGNPGNFDPNDLRGKNIGYVNGWYSNGRCLIQNMVKGAESLKLNQTHYFEFPAGFLEGFEAKKIDAAFGLLWVGENGDYRKAGILGGTPTGLEPIGEVINCSEGLHLGTHKGSRVMEWFNAALRKLKKSGKYAKVCEKAKRDHGAWGTVDCLL